ncbi:hypothetical protein D3C87_1921460 [compost metagenome]
MANPRHVSRIVKGNTDHVARFAVYLTNAGQPALALFHHQPIGKEREALQHHLLARRDQHFPFTLIPHFGFIQAKIFAFPI